MTLDRLPLPTARAAGLAALGLALGIVASADARFAWVLLALDAALFLAFAIDAVRVAQAYVRVRRTAPDPLTAFEPAQISLRVENLSGRAIHGQVEDELPEGAFAEGLPAPYALPGHTSAQLGYRIVSCPRGEKRFGALRVRLEGPWRLAWVAEEIDAACAVRSVPRLVEQEDALLLARPQLEGGLTRLRRLGEGREFDALREYRQGDDLRLVDWKASAKRGALVTREFAPERNQTVMLMIDCGRRMVPTESGRTRLDHAVGAALRLARACLQRGDAVGLVAFDSQRRTFVPPAKGLAQQRALVAATLPLQAELEESDYGAAFDLLGRITRRALVCIFTDLPDRDSSRVLLGRTLGLRPRHLPLLVTLVDSELAAMERSPPRDVESTFVRTAAVRLLGERQAVLSTLTGSGARVVRAPSAELPAAAINEYLRIKERGLL